MEYPGEGDTFEEDVVDSAMVKKDKQPTAPSSMVLFYTWMIVAVLIMVVTISTYQTRCKALRVSGHFFLVILLLLSPNNLNLEILNNWLPSSQLSSVWLFMLYQYNMIG